MAALAREMDATVDEHEALSVAADWEPDEEAIAEADVVHPDADVPPVGRSGRATVGAVTTRPGAGTRSPRATGWGRCGREPEGRVPRCGWPRSSNQPQKRSPLELGAAKTRSLAWPSAGNGLETTYRIRPDSSKTRG